jgi:hypothetical protein
MVKFKGRGDANYGRVSDYIDELAAVALVIPRACETSRHLNEITYILCVF